MDNVRRDFQEDIEDINRIPGIENLLRIVCHTTGMGFSAVARVTEEHWITCCVHDAISFGLKPGDELEIQTTICNEIRAAREAVVIDNVSEDPVYCEHHTPKIYGFQSYISVPIFRKDGSMFGTLCAIDPNVHKVSSPEITELFRLFTDLISFHLNVAENVRDSEKKILEEVALNAALDNLVTQRTAQLAEKNVLLEKMNKELQAFNYISSHDLQEPLRKIQTFASALKAQEINLSPKGKDYFERMQNAAQRMQKLINDLLLYSRASLADRKYEKTDLATILEETEIELADEIITRNTTLVIENTCNAQVIPFQIKQLFINLVSNSIKFCPESRNPVIKISCIIASGLEVIQDIPRESNYCHISVEDNGIGFEQKFGDRIFEVFQRLHNRAQYTGTGIGLAIVKKIADNHNGYVFATGTPDKGARFDIYIPQED